MEHLIKNCIKKEETITGLEEGQCKKLQYRGIWFDIEPDPFPYNPFEDDDGMVPLMYSSGRSNKDYSEGDIALYLSSLITKNQIIYHQKKIAEVLSINLDYFEDVNEKVDNIIYLISQTNSLKALALIANITKTPYLLTSSKGYSQGDYADILLVVTKQFIQETGCDPKYFTQDRLEDTANLWSDWAWGRTFCAHLPSIDEYTCTYFGDNHNKNGLIERVKEIVDFFLDRMKDNRQNKLKKLIRHSVPLDKRKSILIDHLMKSLLS